MSADYEQVYENLQWTDWHAAVEWQQQWYEEARLNWYAGYAKYAAPQRGQPSAANRNYSLEADCEWRKWYLGRWHAAVEWQQQWYEEARLKWYAAHAKYAAPQRGQPSAANCNYSQHSAAASLRRRPAFGGEAGSASHHAKAKSAPAAESNASPSQPGAASWSSSGTPATYQPCLTPSERQLENDRQVAAAAKAVSVPKAKAASVPAVKAPPSPKAKATSSPKAKAKSSPNVTAASPPTPTQHSQPDVWQRRCRHRLAGVAAVKRSSEYINVLMDEAEHSLARPSSPDPHDESLSKRQWERGMQAWRTQLADLVDMRCYQCVN